MLNNHMLLLVHIKKKKKLKRNKAIQAKQNLFKAKPIKKRTFHSLQIEAKN